MLNEINSFSGEKIITMVIFGAIVFFSLAGAIVYHLRKFKSRREEWDRAETMFQGVFLSLLQIGNLLRSPFRNVADNNILLWYNYPVKKVFAAALLLCGRAGQRTAVTSDMAATARLRV